MAKPVVAIVGRPNVGKSMLFNKLIGKRVSIVEDTPGVTRDRIYGETDWNGRKFTLIDTGGIEPRTDNEILSFMREQANIAISHADVIVFLTDIKTGLTASDQEVASMLLRSGKPIVLAVNKMDSVGRVDPDYYEFYNLGMGDPIAVSAVHGHGTGDLLDACVSYFPPEEEEEEEEEYLQVAIIGKPNVGKSSLTNRILGQQRTIVSNVAGTTRDAIDSYFENETGKYVFIDTAGMRKKSKVDESIERYSVLRSQMAIERADVCLILIDAQEGVTEQDTKVAGLAHEEDGDKALTLNLKSLISVLKLTLYDKRSALCVIINSSRIGDLRNTKMLGNLRSYLCGIAVDRLSTAEHYVCAELLDSSRDNSRGCESITTCKRTVCKKERLIRAHSKSLAKSLLCLGGTHRDNGYGSSALFLELKSRLNSSLIVGINNAGNAVTLKSIGDGIYFDFGGVRHLLDTNDNFHFSTYLTF